MVKQHLKRLNVPSSWPIKKKDRTFIKRPHPGAHTFEHGVSIDTLLKNMLKIASSSREVRYILFNKKFLVNGKKQKDLRNLVGLFDVISLEDVNEHYRILLNTKNKLMCVKIDEKEAKIKPSRIIGKTIISKGKFQINMGDGRNFTVAKNQYKVGDSLIFELPEGKVSSHIPLDKGTAVYLISGKHTGTTGKVEKIQRTKIIIQSKDKSTFETNKEFAFPVGTDKPLITLREE